MGPYGLIRMETLASQMRMLRRLLATSFFERLPFPHPPLTPTIEGSQHDEPPRSARSGRPRHRKASCSCRTSAGWALIAAGVLAAPAAFAQSQPQASNNGRPVGSRPAPFSADELVNSGHRFFGNVSRGLATAIESASQKWGQPNGYILGQEGGAAFVGGLRYGEGELYTRNAGDRRVFWQGPSFGFDFGGDGSRTMMLVYNLPGDRRDFQALRRRRRLRLCRRRLQHDRAGRRRDGRRPHQFRRRRAAWRQCRLSEVHA